MRPSTSYAKSGDINIAYQTVGDGPIDLVYVPGWVSHIDYAWENPAYAHLINRLASFSRVICFDKRGTGLSDRDVGFPTLEERMDDVRAVMDAVNSERAALFGVSEGGNMSALFAATYPDRTIALILFGCYARGTWAPDYPWGLTPEERQAWADGVERNWGGLLSLDALAPSALGDVSFQEWLSTYFRYAASPQAAIKLLRLNGEIDIRDVLPMIKVPTLVLHREGDQCIKVEAGRHLAKYIEGSTYVELEGADHVEFTSVNNDILDEIQKFLTGMRRGPDPNRVLLTVLFTDIVGSTERAAEMGDRRWHDLLARHDKSVRRLLKACHGREIRWTGDGFLAVFEGPSRAVQCAWAIHNEMRALGISCRAGIHTGECERLESDIGGIAVHIASRILDKAAANEVLVSQTVRHLAVGAGIRFEDRGEHVLKGVPEHWQLYAAEPTET